MSDYYGRPDKEDYLRELRQKSIYSKQPKRVRRILDDIFDCIVEERIDRERKTESIILSSDLMQHFLPLDGEESETKLSSSCIENEWLSFYCWYESVLDGSDFFNIRELDSSSVVLQMGQVSGHGAASGVMSTGIQYICTDHLLAVRNQRQTDLTASVEFQNLLFRLNDIQCENRFTGRSAALQLFHIDTDTGDMVSNNAGNNIFWQWCHEEKVLRQVESNAASGLGQVDSSMIEMHNETNPEKQMFQDSHHRLDKNDIIFLMTDGVDESHRNYRNRDGMESRLLDVPDEILARDLAENKDFWNENVYLVAQDLWDSCNSTENWAPAIKHRNRQNRRP